MLEKPIAPAPLDPMTREELDRIQRRDKDEPVSPRDWERIQRMPKDERETLC